ncbi:MAG TPA: VOC family protein [Gemmatimonadales bacterium]|nr:VOC family protein [Gemmatimonadales bacterium]
MPNPPLGRFVWHELSTTDPDAAAAFYGKVVGWKTEAYDQDPTYRLLTLNSQQKGGLMRLPEEARAMGAAPGWMLYVSVANVDEKVRQAQSLGAQLHAGPMDIPPGRFAALADPWGAGFSLFKPAPQPNQPMSTGPGAPGDFVWHEHVSPNWTQAWDFYSKLFGWSEAQSLEMSPGNIYFIFKTPGEKEPAGGFYSLQPGMPPHPHWLTYIRVADIDAAASAVKRGGGKVLTGPMDVPGGARIAMCVDPQGAGFAVHALSVGAPAPRGGSSNGTGGGTRARRKSPAKREAVRKAKAASRRPRPKRRTRPRARRPAR